MADFDEKWSLFSHPNTAVMLMSRYAHGVAAYAPLYIHRFQLSQPHTIVDAEKFNIHDTSPSQINNIPDRLKWYRYHKGLPRRDVADFAGLERTTYAAFENNARDYYPIEIMLRISELFSVPVEDLLDEYNLFLYNGQGKQIKETREGRNMTRKEYARRLGVPCGTLKKWERGGVRMMKNAWKNLMERG